jgi:hypothetical protein
MAPCLVLQLLAHKEPVAPYASRRKDADFCYFNVAIEYVQ